MKVKAGRFRFIGSENPIDVDVGDFLGFLEINAELLHGKVWICVEHLVEEAKWKIDSFKTMNFPKP